MFFKKISVYEYVHRESHEADK